MPYPIWPVSLPQKPLNDPYTYAVGSTLIRTAMDTGPAKVRRRQSRSIDLVSVSYTLTKEQLAVLRSFIDNTLLGGVRAFEFPPVCGSGEFSVVRIVPEGENLYTVTTASNLYSVTLTLEIMP